MTDGLQTPAKSIGTKNGFLVRRFVTDALAGMGLFVLGTLLTTGSGAAAATLVLAEKDPSFLLQPETAAQSVILLALVFSLLFAFNAAFFRHLSRAYAKTARK